MSRPKKAKAKKPKDPEVVPQRSLVECLDSLNSIPEHSPLPCRESQIERVARFFDTALQKGQDSAFLFLYGEPGTGKTASVRFCMETVEKPKLVQFHNCASAGQFGISMIKRGVKVIVLDEMDHFKGVTKEKLTIESFLAKCQAKKISVIGIANTDEGVPFDRDEEYSIPFPVYTAQDLETILTELMGGPTTNIPEKALHFFAARALKDGDARVAIQLFSKIIADAIDQGLTEISIGAMNKLIEQNNASKKQASQLVDLDEFAQLGLVSLFKRPKDWVKYFKSNLPKGFDDVVPAESIFERLLCDGLVDGTVKKPKLRSTITQEFLEMNLTANYSRQLLSCK